MNYTLYSEIKSDLLTIQKSVLDADDGYADNAWQELKATIAHLAQQCRELEAIRKARDRAEAAGRRGLKLNTTQLSALREAVDAHRQSGLITCGDRCTQKALVARGYAIEHKDGTFTLTDEAYERSRFAADVKVTRDGVPDDPSLMEDVKPRVPTDTEAKQHLREVVERSIGPGFQRMTRH